MTVKKIKRMITTKGIVLKNKYDKIYCAQIGSTFCNRFQDYDNPPDSVVLYPIEGKGDYGDKVSFKKLQEYIKQGRVFFEERLFKKARYMSKNHIRLKREIFDSYPLIVKQKMAGYLVLGSRINKNFPEIDYLSEEAKFIDDKVYLKSGAEYTIDEMIAKLNDTGFNLDWFEDKEVK